MLDLFNIKYSDLNKIKRLSPRNQGHYLPFDTYPHGAPLGGFGAGTIGRSPYGDFNIWHIKVGAHIAEEIKACTFHVYQKNDDNIYKNLLVSRPFVSKKLDSFANPFSINSGSYSAAFPKAKYTFQDKLSPATIVCEQFSPILPHNYKESSYPLAIFNHKVSNPTNKTIEVAIMMTWANMTNWKFEEQRPGVQDNCYSFVPVNEGQLHITKKTKKYSGIVLGNKSTKISHEMAGEFCLATILGKDRKVTIQKYFYINGNGEEITKPFYQTGELKNHALTEGRLHQSYGAAIAVKIKLKPGEVKEIPFVFAWDLPIVKFGGNIKRYKYFTNFFGKNGIHSWQLAIRGLQNLKKWSRLIDGWHANIIKHSKLFPNKLDNNSQYYFKMLINELYFLSDGGTFWDANTGDFGILECFDYPFYETLDVRFYGSFPLLKFWPKIELKIMENFSKTINQSNDNMIRYNLFATDPKRILPKSKNARISYYDKRMLKGSCPHDLGMAKNNPFKDINDYTWQNVNYWKDLNSKFVLLCYRDFKYSKDKSFLIKCWPAIKAAMLFLEKMDKDRDGIPENSGYPDQTYDNWIMHGVSAYCGSLWLAALRATTDMAKALNDKFIISKYQKMFTNASLCFEKKLWNGRYFDFDEKCDDIMADQLIGQWYLDVLNEKPLFSEKKIRSTLKTIYKYNFKKTASGKWGVISGKKKNNGMTDTEQGRDIWVGTNFAITFMMMRHGMKTEAKQILKSVSDVIFNRGLFFRTPEGWDNKGRFTATMYMRPNAIWSAEL